MEATQMEATQIKAIAYLWSRDAGMEFTPENKSYLARELALISSNARPIYSDPERERMAAEVASEWVDRMIP